MLNTNISYGFLTVIITSHHFAETVWTKPEIDHKSLDEMLSFSLKFITSYFISPLFAQITHNVKWFSSAH